MIDLTKKNILTDNLDTLKETSKDTANGSYMSNSMYQVVNFDLVKKSHIFKGSHICSHNLRSNDALVLLSNDKFVFIEFKNGNLDTYAEELKNEKIRSKINESLWILNDIIEENLQFDRQSINYILVYNKSKNAKYALKSSLAKLAHRSFLISGYEKYEVFFHRFETIDEIEFLSVSNALETGTYTF